MFIYKPQIVERFMSPPTYASDSQDNAEKMSGQPQDLGLTLAGIA